MRRRQALDLPLAILCATPLLACGATDTDGVHVPTDTSADTAGPPPLSPTVVNGAEDANGVFPGVVMVSNGGTCTGTLVGERDVLTAGHCVCDAYTADNGVSRQDATHCAARVKVVFVGATGVVSETRWGDVTVHPDYEMVFNDDGFIDRSSADLATVRLDGCGPPWAPTYELADDAPQAGDDVVLVGFGRDGCDGTAGTRRYGRNHVHRTETELIKIVAELAEGETITWKGDSGGPLLWDNRVAGVLSKGYCNASDTGAGHFTNVRTYAGWISDRIDPAMTCFVTENLAPSAPLIFPPTDPRVGTAADVRVVLGFDPDGDVTKVQCTSAGSSFASPPYDSGELAEGSAVLAPFMWASAGPQTLSCTTFDPDGAASPVASVVVDVAPGEVTPQCVSGPCCTAGGTFAPASQVCEEGIVQSFRCPSGECGGQAEHREDARRCSGTSAACDGEIVTGAWIGTSCTSTEACALDGAGVSFCQPTDSCTGGTGGTCAPCDDSLDCLPSWTCVNYSETDIWFCAGPCGDDSDCESDHYCYTDLSVCVPKASQDCVAGDVWAIDSCGHHINRDVDCVGTEICQDSGAEASCVAPEPLPPSVPSINGPGSVEVGATATFTVTLGTDPDGTQTKVQCTSAGSDHGDTNPYDSGWRAEGSTVSAPFSWGTAGTKTVHCKTIDVDGEESATANRTISVVTPQPQAPTAPSISGPGSVEVGATATFSVTLGTDPDGTQTKVQCASTGSNHSDGAPYDSGLRTEGTSVSVPFSWGSAGTKTVYCTTFDVDGNASASATKALNVVVPQPQPPTAPTVDAPSSGYIGIDINVSVTLGTDPDGTQTKVQCASPGSTYPDGAAYDSGFRTEGTTVVPKFKWTSAGTKTIYCTTFDADGQSSSTATDSISISVAAAAGSGSLSAPSNGSTKTGAFSVSGTASDANGLDRVSVAFNWSGGSHNVIVCDGSACGGTSKSWTVSVDPASFSVPNNSSLTIAVWVRDDTGDTDGPFSARTILWYRDWHITANYTSSYSPSPSSCPGADSELYLGQASSISGNLATMRFKKCGSGTIGAGRDWWVVTGDAIYPTSNDLNSYVARASGTFGSTSSTQTLSSIAIWPTTAAARDADCGATKNLFLVTDGADRPHQRAWYQHRVVTFTKHCD